MYVSRTIYHKRKVFNMTTINEYTQFIMLSIFTYWWTTNLVIHRLCVVLFISLIHINYTLLRIFFLWTFKSRKLFHLHNFAFICIIYSKKIIVLSSLIHCSFRYYVEYYFSLEISESKNNELITNMFWFICAFN